MFMCHNVFNVWPKTALLPVWPRDAKKLDTLWRVPNMENVVKTEKFISSRKNRNSEAAG